MSKVAIIRIRGIPKIKTTIVDTMHMLGLDSKHGCSIVEMTDTVKGMIKKIDGYVAWGEVSEDSVKLLEEKRGKTAKKNEFKSVYFLAPPVKGFERGGIKKHFSVGGALGYRADKINDLIKRMV